MHYVLLNTFDVDGAAGGAGLVMEVVACLLTGSGGSVSLLASCCGNLVSEACLRYFYSRDGAVEGFSHYCSTLLYCCLKDVCTPDGL